MSKRTKKPPVLAPSATNGQHEPAPAEIALYAYSIWEREGRPQNRDLQNWLQAEAELRQTNQAAAGQL